MVVVKFELIFFIDHIDIRMMSEIKEVKSARFILFGKSSLAKIVVKRILKENYGFIETNNIWDIDYNKILFDLNKNNDSYRFLKNKGFSVIFITNAFVGISYDDFYIDPSARSEEIYENCLSLMATRYNFKSISDIINIKLFKLDPCQFKLRY